MESKQSCQTGLKGVSIRATVLHNLPTSYMDHPKLYTTASPPENYFQANVTLTDVLLGA